MDFLGDLASGTAAVRRELQILLDLAVLLYADDTTVLADSAGDLNRSLSYMNDYCKKSKLEVNIAKTKIVIFSRGKVRVFPKFYIGTNEIEVVSTVKYLGLCFNYNGKFAVGVKDLCSRARKAMFAIFTKMTKLNLGVDTLLHLFNMTVKPILLYGCEVWGISSLTILNMIEKVQLQFLKTILQLRNSTSSVMVYGETGSYPLIIDIKIRLVTFWLQLCQSKHKKLSCAMMKLSVFRHPDSDFSWLFAIKHILDTTGLSSVWYRWKYINPVWLKNRIKTVLRDQFVQSWNHDILSMKSCSVYCMMKDSFDIENYLLCLPKKYRTQLCRFRCRNSKLPVVKKTFDSDVDDTCVFCSEGKGDEIHVLLFCSKLNTERKKYLPGYFTRYPSVEKFNALFKLNSPNVKNLCMFIDCINHLLEQTSPFGSA